MKYSMEKALFHFTHNRIIYSILILVYAVSMTVFMSCFNLSLSCAGQLRAIRSRTETEGIEISFSGMFSQGYVITQQDIREYPSIEEKLLYFPYRDSRVIDADGNDYRYQCCFLSDIVFERLFGIKREAGAVYIGRDAYDTLKRLKERAAGQNEGDQYFLQYRFEGDIVYLGEEPVADLAQIKLLDETQGNIRLNSSNAMFSMDEEQLCLSDCLILPAERMEESCWETEAMPYGSVIAVYQGERNDENMGELMSFMRFLSGRHPEVQYGISDRILSLEKSASDLMIPYRSLLLAAFSLLFIIMTGMIGIFILILHRRRREQAVSLAYGATKSQIFMEVFVEVFLCFAIGGVLAGAAAWFVTPGMEVEGIHLVGAWHGVTVLCAAGITLLEALGISGIALAVVGRENVAGTLKEL